MTTGMNFWDAEVWSFIVSLGALLLAMMAANALQKLIKPLRRLMIPSSVLGGFLLLGVMWLVRALGGGEIVTTSLLEMITYHGLGLGFAAMALRSMEKKQDKRSRTGAFDCGVTVVCGYLMQAVVGLAVTLLLYKLIGGFFASGILLPMGYGQGPGQAYNWGHTYELQYGFANGTSFGLTVAAMGFVSASVGGVIFLNHLRRKGVIHRELGEDVQEQLSVSDFEGENEIPQSESMDKFSVQMALVFGSYLIAYLFMYGVNCLIETGVLGGLGSTLQSLIWGFQFLFSTLAAMLVKAVMRALKNKGVIKREYTNNYMQNRIAGFMFDLMVVSSIAAIDLSAFTKPDFLVPLTIICILGAVTTYAYLRFVCKRVFPMYEYEAFASLYGMQTGTASTGAILLRELDPKFETQAADNLVYHQLWAIVFGFPIMLLMGVAPQSPAKAVITMLIALALFVAFNILLLRRSLFRKKQ